MRSTIVSGRWGTIGLALALLALAGCGGGGSSAPETPPGKLFVVDAFNRAIASMSNSNPGPGFFAIERIISGSNTGLGTPGGTPSPSTIPSIALDAAADRLYVATQLNTRVFDQISTASGNVSSRSISAPSVNFLNLSIDSATNTLYTVGSGVINIFNNAHTINGSTTPSRTITPDFGASSVFSTFGIAIDTTSRNMLYVGVNFNGATRIVVFNNATTADTTGGAALAPDRTLDFATAPGAFYLDTVHDRLYTAQFNGPILVFDIASGLMTGTVTPSRTISLLITQTSFSSSQLYIFVDTTNDRLYAVNGTDGFILNGASTANDPINPYTQFRITSPTTVFSAVAAKP
jgi:hypothetical protein